MTCSADARQPDAHRASSRSVSRQRRRSASSTSQPQDLHRHQRPQPVHRLKQHRDYSSDARRKPARQERDRISRGRSTALHRRQRSEYYHKDCRNLSPSRRRACQRDRSMTRSMKRSDARRQPARSAHSCSKPKSRPTEPATRSRPKESETKHPWRKEAAPAPLKPQAETIAQRESCREGSSEGSSYSSLDARVIPAPAPTPQPTSPHLARPPGMEPMMPPNHRRTLEELEEHERYLNEARAKRGYPPRPRPRDLVEQTQAHPQSPRGPTLVR